MLYFRNFSIFFSASPKSYSACINQPSFSFNFKINFVQFLARSLTVKRILFTYYIIVFY